jgi:hypothetical protein
MTNPIRQTEVNTRGLASNADTLSAINDIMADFREDITGGVRAITTDHASIHLGWGYSIYASFANVANGNIRYIALTTPNVDETERPYVHLKFYDTWISNASGICELLENPSAVTKSGDLTVMNRDRIKADEASSVVAITASDITGGTVLELLRFGGGGTGPQGRSGGDRSIDIEWVLKPNTTYVFRITNTSGSEADIGFWAFWYEEPDKA